MFFCFFFRFFALLLVYLIAGVLIKRYKMGVESVPEVTPNYEFWAGIPCLVKVNRSRLYQGITKRLIHGTRNQESRKVLVVESGFLDLGNWNTAHGIRNPILKIRNPRRGIQNPRLY